MKAELIDGYYFVTSDNNSLLGEKDDSIMRFEKEEFESFIDNFIVARELNKSMGVEPSRSITRDSVIKVKPRMIPINRILWGDL